MWSFGGPGERSGLDSSSSKALTRRAIEGQLTEVWDSTSPRKAEAQGLLWVGLRPSGCWV